MPGTASHQQQQSTRRPSRSVSASRHETALRGGLAARTRRRTPNRRILGPRGFSAATVLRNRRKEQPYADEERDDEEQDHVPGRYPSRWTAPGCVAHPAGYGVTRALSYCLDVAGAISIRSNR